LLRINEIDVSYGNVQILRKVTFDIREKEIVSLLGSNGAGKTTTVSAVSGILQVSRGGVEFMGQDITRVEPHQRVEMGLVQVPEGRKIFPTLTVMENLEMGSYLPGPKSKRQETLGFVLSGGEDYELLFTARPKDSLRIKALSKRLALPITRIGEIKKPGKTPVTLMGVAGPVKPRTLGFLHF